MAVTVQVWEYDNPLNGKARTAGRIDLVEHMDRGVVFRTVYHAEWAVSLGSVLGAIIDTLQFAQIDYKIRRTAPHHLE